MKISYNLRLTLLWLVLGLGLSNVQPVRGQINTNNGSLFQYAIFYNGLLEFSDCASLTINGPVHCNTNIDIGTPTGNTLTFNYLVTSSGIITNPVNDGIAQSSWTGTTTYNGTPAPGYATGEPVLMAPLGAASNSPAAIIQLPTVSDGPTNQLSYQRYYYQAVLVILVTNITTSVSTNTVTNVVTSVIIKNSMFDPQPLVFSYTNNLAANTASYTNMATNWTWFGASNWLSTNATFFDSRQNQTNLVTQIDVGKFGAWISTNTNCLAKWNATNPFNGIIYVADTRTTNGMYMDCVRLTNGQTIPTIGASNTSPYTIPGLTVATINPLYICGLYNCPSATTNVGSTNIIGTAHCSVVCDALTILSPNWRDGNSWNEFPPPAATTNTVNTAIIAGNVPSTGSGVSQYSGGVHNLTRLLEDWSGQTLWLNTSIINLYPSAQATAQFEQPPVYYYAPTRNFSFDQAFNNTNSLPPGAPQYHKYAATFIVTNLTATFDTSSLDPVITTIPAGLHAFSSFVGVTNWPVPTNAGTYEMVSVISDPVFFGTSTNICVINKATAAVTVTNLSQVWNGSAKYVSVFTSPHPLGLTVTYNGSTNAPVNAGSYTVVAAVNDTNYQGSATGTLVISQASATVNLANLAQNYDGTTKTVSANTSPTGLAVNVTYNGSTNAPITAGSYTVIGTISDPNYQGSITNTLVIGQAAASVSLNNLLQTYSGFAESVGETTVPSGLNVVITYNGGPNAPMNTGSYAVIATVQDTNYQGMATNTLVIVPPAAGPITLSGAATLADGTFQLSFTNTPGASFSVLGSADPSQPVTNWAVLGSVIEVSPGQFQFVDEQATNEAQQFYIIRSP